MSWWWQLLLDHGITRDESVESGNECSKLRMPLLAVFLLFPIQHLFSFTFFYDTEPFISYAPNCHFIFRYPLRVKRVGRGRRRPALHNLVRHCFKQPLARLPVMWCVIKSLKSIKNDLKSIGFYCSMADFTVVSHHRAANKKRLGDCEGCDVIIQL